MALVELIMPKLGESITEATILKWLKSAGDKVQQDETLLEIATDKVDSEVPSTAEGIIRDILFNVNDVVPVGAVIAHIETEAAVEVEQAPAAPVIDMAPKTSAPEEEEVFENIPYQPVQAHNLPTNGHRFYSPLVLNIANSEGISLSDLEHIPGTGNEGRVTKKDILQYVAEQKMEDTRYRIQDSIEKLQDTGFKIEDSSKKVQDTSFKIQEGSDKIQDTSFKIQEGSDKIQDTSFKIQEGSNKIQDTSFKIQDAGNRVQEVNQPVESFKPATTQAPSENKASQTSSPATIKTPAIHEGNVEIIEMDRMRKLIAKHMVDSKQTSAHVTSFAEADVTNMVLWREKVKKDFEKREHTKITYMPLFIECLVRVMKRYPLINSSIDGDKIIIKRDLNIGMATALQNGNLIVPVIRNADYLNLVGLSKAVNTLADSARNNRLKPDDTQGGTFTLTNVGTFGSLMGTPIINQPQVAILAVGAIKKRPVVVETEQGDTIGIRHMMYLSLSYDHRIVDGSLGASFLTAVAKEFENWDVERGW